MPTDAMQITLERLDWDTSNSGRSHRSPAVSARQLLSERSAYPLSNLQEEISGIQGQCLNLGSKNARRHSSDRHDASVRNLSQSSRLRRCTQMNG